MTAGWDDAHKHLSLEPVSCDTSLQVRAVNEKKVTCEVYCLHEEGNTSVHKSKKSRAGIPSMRKPASRERISASVELCETDVCFLHIQLIRTNG